MDPITIIFLVLFLGATIAAVVFVMRAKVAVKHAADLEKELTQSESQVSSYQAEIDAMKGEMGKHQQDLALAQQEMAHLGKQMKQLESLSVEKLDEQEAKYKGLMAEKLAHANEQKQLLEEEFSKREKQLKKQFDETQASAEKSFRSLASKALENSNEQFLKLAKEKLKGEQKDAKANLKERETAIKNLVDPIREKLEKYDKTIHEIEQSRQKSYGELSQTVKRMILDQQGLRDETAKLVGALKRPEVRGRWGEMQLRKVAELAGMIDHCDFTEQVSVDGGKLRPDMVVNLPSSRQIVIDAKTPIDAYVAALETVTKEDQIAKLEKHTKNIVKQVDELSKKKYAEQFERTPDFVVMFIPGEAFLQPAVMERPMLLEDAMEKGVVIATPTTLIALLKAVAMGWREEALAENARQIAAVGKDLHKRLATCTKHLENLGKAVTKSVEHFNKFVGSYESQVMSKARQFETLGAGSNKSLPTESDGSYGQIEMMTRSVKVIESQVVEDDSSEDASNQRLEVHDVDGDS
ncbi:DNA recombination protein RmuC [Poriferisphaera sp. WC338]|uniref:DNA recombination protein RmuC n=1 Tax=Poriferisphaera sp. WC338 TaxID=3425129 RepID=UPI003D819150